jgi:DNA-binding beta-propeller fold protein YncE
MLAKADKRTIVFLSGLFIIAILAAGCGGAGSTATTTTTAVTIATTTTIADPAPYSPAIPTIRRGDTILYLSWSKGWESDLGGYNLYRSLSETGTYAKINTAVLTGETYVDSGLVNLTTYYYKLTVLDLAGHESEPSLAGSGIPKEIYVTGEAWGRFGTGEGEMKSPLAIIADADGNILVSDYVNKRINKYDDHGNYLGKITTYGTREIQRPYGLAIDSSGNLYVCHDNDNFTESIIVFDRSGNYLKQIGLGLFFGLQSVAVGPDGYVYAVESSTAPELYVFDATGAFVRKWSVSSTSSSDTRLLAVDDESHIYLLMEGEGVIRQYDKNGSILRSLSLTGPRGIAFGQDGKIYVLGKYPGDASVYYGKAMKLTKNLELITSWENPDDSSYVYHAERGCIALGADGVVYVIEHREIGSETMRVQEYVKE